MPPVQTGIINPFNTTKQRAQKRICIIISRYGGKEEQFFAAASGTPAQYRLAPGAGQKVSNKDSQEEEKSKG
jgi:hypothetical protein